MQKLLLIVCIGMASCQEATTTIPHMLQDAEERRKRSDSILNAFKKVNESIKASNEKIPDANDSILTNMDSVAKGVGAFKRESNR